MQNAHPDEFFKFDFPGHEISNENNFIRTFFTLIFASGIETRFSVPLANFFFFFLYYSNDQINLLYRSIILAYSRKSSRRKFARSISIFPEKRFLIGKLDVIPEYLQIDFSRSMWIISRFPNCTYLNCYYVKTGSISIFLN